MKIRLWCFNTYLLAGLLGLFAGCATSSKDSTAKDVREDAALRLHLEVNPDGTDNSAAVLVGRAAPFLVNLEKAPFLTELQIDNATLNDTLGGYAISIKFNDEGRQILEQYTTAYKGKRIGVAVIFGEKHDTRWVAAPRITQRITNGVFRFTPATTQAEADRLVAGLNNYAKKVKQGRR
jgi:preprotein translocase subunit SecD